MRTKIPLVIAAISLFSAAMSGESIRFCQGEDMQVSFADESLSATNRTLIASDLGRVFSFPANASEVINLSVQHAPNEYEIREFASMPYCDEIGTGLVFQVSAASTNLLVKPSLSSAYTNAFQLLPRFQEKLRELDTLISDINSGAVQNYSLAKKKALIHIDGQETTEEQAEENLVGIDTEMFFMPSILDFKTDRHWTDADDVPTSIVHSMPKNGQLLDYDAIPMIYLNGEWGVFAK